MYDDFDENISAFAHADLFCMMPEFCMVSNTHDGCTNSAQEAKFTMVKLVITLHSFIEGWS